MPGEVWDNTTSPESNAGGGSNYHSPVRDRVLKIVYTIIGTLGIVDNLFVLIVFILFIKITEKVSNKGFPVKLFIASEVFADPTHLLPSTKINRS